MRQQQKKKYDTILKEDAEREDGSNRNSNSACIENDEIKQKESKQESN